MLRFISLLLFVLLLQGAMNSDMRHSDIELFFCVEKQSVSKLKNYVKSADGVLSQIEVMKSKVTSMESGLLKAGCAGHHRTPEAEEILFLSYL